MKNDNTELAEKIQLEIPKVKAEILDVDEIEAMSISDIENAKKYLDLRRKQVQVHLDGKKLDQALVVMDNMGLILDKIYNGLMDNSLTPMDIKFLSDAYDKLNRTQSMLARFDSMNENGGAALINIEVRW